MILREAKLGGCPAIRAGIYNTSNAVGANLLNLTILHNTGSGVYNAGTTAAVVLNLIQALVMSNSATTGAGVANNGDAASMNTYRSRLAYNVASASGGGAWNWGTMSIVNCAPGPLKSAREMR